MEARRDAMSSDRVGFGGAITDDVPALGWPVEY